MPTFEFTAPDGRTFTVDGPPGSTKEQAFQVLQSRLQDVPTQPTAADIPVGEEERAYGAQQAAPAPAPAPQTLGDKIIGAGETALTLATGATGGAVGMLGGTVKGLAGAVMDGTFGTPEGVRQVERAAGEGAAALTYQPRTAAGQEQAAAVGELAAAAVPATGLTAELQAAGRAAGAAGSAARDVAAPAAQVGLERIRAAAPAIAERVQRTLSRTPDTPTPGTRASGGSAGTDMATQRRQVADQVGVKLTSGQATRDQQQLRFEQETAKGEHGAPLRDRYSAQNEQIGKHFDHLVDMTGAEAADMIGTGRTVDQALRAKMARDKAEVRVAYKRAETAGEMEDPVQLDALVAHLNESAPDAATAPLLTTARGRALQLGIAAEGPDGKLVPTATTLKNAERYRQAIGRATDLEATNIRQATIIKGAIDAATDGLGGGLYRAARRTRENFAKQYEDRAVVASLLNNKRGMADRKVALEDVFEHVVLKGDREDVGHVRRVLQTGGDEGKQAWRELQGATMTWLKNEAFGNTATDQRGNVILSVPKLDRALKRLEEGGKLEFMFGKQGAQHLRDLNDLAKVVYTAPPGAVNTSNTASVLLAALSEAGATGAITGLPVPVLSGLRVLAKQVKNRQLQKRIEQALQSRPTPSTPQPVARPHGATLH
ncbi:hypothetical protein [Massilia sp. ZL223]|uniref:hypothetical protein n=1 Tax=Massilia sp. ZL223 TaxID=2824904 RepID=UPI001B815B53|nr:hypothetical protein [Massilia sp. ZL223]MBQ5963139.1 hypothetical protein [Massilia sp. ZL223]